MVKVKSATKSGYEEANPGDSINLSLPNSTTSSCRVGQSQAQTLDTQSNQAVLLEDKELILREGRDNRSCLRAGSSTELGFEGYSIRRLTETECERLQGFNDGWTQYGNYNGEIKKISRTNRYKMCGNAVTVDIVKLIGMKLLESLK